MGNPQAASQRQFVATVRKGQSATIYNVPATDTVAALIRLSGMVSLFGCRVSVRPA